MLRRLPVARRLAPAEPDHCHVETAAAGELLSQSGPIVVRCYDAECGRPSERLAPEAVRAFEQAAGYR